jgi:hypothetical protein
MESQRMGRDDDTLSSLDSGERDFSAFVAYRESRDGSVFLRLNSGEGLFTMSSD